MPDLSKRVDSEDDCVTLRAEAEKKKKHRKIGDFNCSNVFVNGNTGQVKIGDLELAAIVGKRQ